MDISLAYPTFSLTILGVPSQVSPVAILPTIVHSIQPPQQAPLSSSPSPSTSAPQPIDPTSSDDPIPRKKKKRTPTPPEPKHTMETIWDNSHTTPQYKMMISIAMASHDKNDASPLSVLATNPFLFKNVITLCSSQYESFVCDVAIPVADKPLPALRPKTVFTTGYDVLGFLNSQVSLHGRVFRPIQKYSFGPRKKGLGTHLPCLIDEKPWIWKTKKIPSGVTCDHNDEFGLLFSTSGSVDDTTGELDEGDEGDDNADNDGVSSSSSSSTATVIVNNGKHNGKRDGKRNGINVFVILKHQHACMVGLAIGVTAATTNKLLQEDPAKTNFKLDGVIDQMFTYSGPRSVRAFDGNAYRVSFGAHPWETVVIDQTLIKETIDESTGTRSGLVINVLP